MVKKIKSIINIKDINNLGQNSFYIGVFFLPSALPISGLFFLISLFISYRKIKFNFISDKWDLSILIGLILIIISTLFSTTINIPDYPIYQDKTNILLGLFNWLPLFFAFWGFKEYLRKESQRIKTAKFLISGSFPVLLSCLMQKLQIFGPFKAFFGLIIWFNKPISETVGLTGLFSNPNYLGIFLIIILPFILYLTKNDKNTLIRKIIIYSFLLSSIYFSYLTNSRNAFLGIFIALLTLINRKKIIYFISASITSFFIFKNLVERVSQDKFLNICLSNIRPVFCKFSDIRNNNIGFMTPRIKLWNYVISLIKERPLFGWGSSTFGNIFSEISTDTISYNHTHNLFLEVTYNFGIPASIILSLTVISISFITFKEVIIINKANFNNQFNKAWLASLFAFLFTHISDVTYYDGKISLLFVILMAGTSCILKEVNEFKKNNS